MKHIERVREALQLAISLANDNQVPAISVSLKKVENGKNGEVDVIFDNSTITGQEFRVIIEYLIDKYAKLAGVQFRDVMTAILAERNLYEWRADNNEK